MAATVNHWTKLDNWSIAEVQAAGSSNGLRNEEIKAKHRLKTNWRHVEGVQKVLKVLKILKNHRRCENFGCAGHWGCDPSNLALRGRSPRSPRSLGLRPKWTWYENIRKCYKTLRKRWILWILWILHNSPTVLALLFHSFSIFSRFSSARFQLHICWQKWKISTMNCEMRNLAETAQQDQALSSCI